MISLCEAIVFLLHKSNTHKIIVQLDFRSQILTKWFVSIVDYLQMAYVSGMTKHNRPKVKMEAMTTKTAAL
jgi:hypothetical protein